MIASLFGSKTEHKEEVPDDGKLPTGEIKKPPTDFHQYDDELVDQLLKAAGIREDKDNKYDWIDMGVKNDVHQFYAKDPNSPIYIFKGVGEVPASVRDVERAIRDPQNMRIIDPMCKITETVTTFDKNHHIYYAQFKLPSPVWHRDFVWWSVEYNLPSGAYVTVGKSIVCSDKPETKDHVRGEIRASGYVVEPIEGKEDACKVTYIVQTDPRGWLPAWAVNIVAASQAYNPGIIKEKSSSFLAELRRNSVISGGGGNAPGDYASHHQPASETNPIPSTGPEGSEQSEGSEQKSKQTDA